MSVLIETYWNVKKDVRTATGLSVAVLIETYWNVKTYASEAADGVATY